MGKDEDDMLPQTCPTGQGKKRVSDMWREDTWGYLKDILPIEALKETLRREGSSLAAVLSLKTPAWQCVDGGAWSDKEQISKDEGEKGSGDASRTPYEGYRGTT